jgi:hypothetical protein
LHQFHRFCPFTIPWIIDEDPNAGSRKLFQALEYKVEDGKIVEKKDKWMDRMIKSFCIFAQIIIQEEQTPFNLADGWMWLARFANMIPR